MTTVAKVMLPLLVALLVKDLQALSPPKINYCRNRSPSECCTEGRDDDCTVPIKDTVCYCDSFCLEDDEDNGAHDDCCPDYREVCLGQTLAPTPGFLVLTETAVCIYNGAPLSPGKHTCNCNECVCDNGRLTSKEEQCMVDKDVIAEVNGDPRGYGWTATNYSMFWGKKAMDGLFLRTGTLIPDDKTKSILPILLRPDPSRIPHEFDARIHWNGLISGVRDQGWCGASWAFSTVGVAQDRQMILNRESVSLAPQQMFSCSQESLGSCEGGHIDGAWNYMRKVGLVEESCFPYSSGASGKVPDCPSYLEMCKTFKMEPAYRISDKEEDIQWEIMTNGPVQAVMWVTRHLFMYRSGIYHCTRKTGEPMGLHSVRILGWGEDTTLFGPSTKYWLVANSWGTDWGEDGLFRIRRGTNECGIESFVLAVRGRRDPWAKNGNGF